MATEYSFSRLAAGMAFASVALATLSCSSGGSLHPVLGQVLVNSQPAAGASVIFHPEGGDMKSVPATGIVGADGKFTLATGDKQGVRPGKYVVTVVWPDPAKKPTQQQIMMGLVPDAPDLLKGQYATPQISTLRAEIKPGDNKLEPFDLK